MCASVWSKYSSAHLRLVGANVCVGFSDKYSLDHFSEGLSASVVRNSWAHESDDASSAIAGAEMWIYKVNCISLSHCGVLIPDPSYCFVWFLYPTYTTFVCT